MKNFFYYEDIKLETLTINNQKSKNILILHGYTSEFAFYEPIYSLLQDEYNIYGINMPSHGQSDISKKHMQNDIFAQIVIKFVNHLKLKNIVVIGHSMGGGVAMDVAWRLEDRVIKIVLLGPSNRTMLSYNHHWPLFFPRNVEQYKKLVPILYYNSNLILQDEEKIQNIAQYYANEEVQKKLDVIYEFGKQMPLESNQAKVDYGIKMCKVPIILINGDHDGIVHVKNCERHYTSLNPNVFTFVIKNSGHCMWFDDFDTFMRILKSQL
ncbi:alpha/beta hydrolase [Mycoplasmopsis phocirhinis]|uniref:Alpha/beta hydrolase n=1 Tax=Mycoplasmopsis phocirhinis TaxID=142650 RepID=A0A4P6MT21_9BACT|nr:alpha/beta hydrolase [Mycoplasmopsis phocirhinis]QBF34457.1 alpha/beta hydrolase [Mycoplasmopsis phocirhinis]